MAGVEFITKRNLDHALGLILHSCYTHPGTHYFISSTSVKPLRSAFNILGDGLQELKGCKMNKERLHVSLPNKSRIQFLVSHYLRTENIRGVHFSGGILLGGQDSAHESLLLSRLTGIAGTDQPSIVYIT